MSYENEVLCQVLDQMRKIKESILEKNELLKETKSEKQETLSEALPGVTTRRPFNVKPMFDSQPASTGDTVSYGGDIDINQKAPDCIVPAVELNDVPSGNKSNVSGTDSEKQINETEPYCVVPEVTSDGHLSNVGVTGEKNDGKVDVNPPEHMDVNQDGVNSGNTKKITHEDGSYELEEYNKDGLLTKKTFYSAFLF